MCIRDSAHCAGARVHHSAVRVRPGAAQPHGIPGAGTGRRAYTAAGGARYGAHTSDPCAFRVPGASAGGRRHVRRMSGAHGAPGAALRRGIVWPAGGECGAHSARAAARRHACAAGGVWHPVSYTHLLWAGKRFLQQNTCAFLCVHDRMNRLQIFGKRRRHLFMTRNSIRRTQCWHNTRFPRRPPPAASF